MVQLDSVPAALKAAANVIRSFRLPSTPPSDRPEFFKQFQDINTAVTKAVRDALADVAPEIGWLDLEAETGRPGRLLHSGSWWVCDPIDGAVQLLQGMNAWCISLALITDGVAVSAWVYDPAKDEMFHASIGEGATVNGRPMSASPKSDLADAFVATSHAPGQNQDGHSNALAGAAYTAALNTVGAVRNLGPTSLQLAWVADGRIDAFWAFGADQSNWVAGSVLAAEAGASTTDIRGAVLTSQSTSILTAGPALAESLRQMLTRTNEPPLTGAGPAARLLL
jgi:myo-inositol-1(or 4)-monophosphatase